MRQIYEAWSPDLGETRETAMSVDGVSPGDAAETYAEDRELKVSRRVLVAKGSGEPSEFVIEVEMIPVYAARKAG